LRSNVFKLTLTHFSIASHFNYSKAYSQRGQVFKYRTAAQSPPGNYPMSAVDHKSGYFSIIQLGISGFSGQDYLDENHHESLVHEGAKYLIHSPYELFSRESASHETIVNHSLIVYVNPQKTIIDKALESYPPER
jgi:hypothetical protein